MSISPAEPIVTVEVMTGVLSSSVVVSSTMPPSTGEEISSEVSTKPITVEKTTTMTAAIAMRSTFTVVASELLFFLFFFVLFVFFPIYHLYHLISSLKIQFPSHRTFCS